MDENRDNSPDKKTAQAESPSSAQKFLSLNETTDNSPIQQLFTKKGKANGFSSSLSRPSTRNDPMSPSKNDYFSPNKEDEDSPSKSFISFTPLPYIKNSSHSIQTQQLANINENTSPHTKNHNTSGTLLDRQWKQKQEEGAQTEEEEKKVEGRENTIVRPEHISMHAKGEGEGEGRSESITEIDLEVEDRKMEIQNIQEKKQKGIVRSLLVSMAERLTKSKYIMLPDKRAERESVIAKVQYDKPAKGLDSFENIMPCMEGQKLNHDKLRYHNIFIERIPAIWKKLKKLNQFMRANFAHICLLNREIYLVLPWLYNIALIIGLIFLVKDVFLDNPQIWSYFYFFALFISFVDTIYRIKIFRKIYRERIHDHPSSDFFRYKLNFLSFFLIFILGLLHKILTDNDSVTLFYDFIGIMILHKITHLFLYFTFYIFLGIPFTIIALISFFVYCFLIGMKGIADTYIRERNEISIEPAINAGRLRIAPGARTCRLCSDGEDESRKWIKTLHCNHHMHLDCFQKRIIQRKIWKCPHPCGKSLYM
jgi:hypothetical protein